MVPITFLPANLPRLLTAKEGKKPDPTKYAPEKIQLALKHFLDNDHRNVTPEDEIYFIRFLRKMTRDPVWVAANSDFAKKVLGAATFANLILSNERHIAKIQKYIKAASPEVKALAPFDIQVGIGQQKIPASTLILTDASPVFDRMLRVQTKEGVALRAYHSAPSKMESPVIAVNGVQVNIVNALMEILHFGKNDKLKSLTDAEKESFVAYVDMTDTFKSVFPLAEKIFGDSINSENADLLNHMHAYYIKKEKIPNKGSAEQSLINLVTALNAREFYNFAKAKGLFDLRDHCLKYLIRDITVQNAFLGATQKSFPGMPIGLEENDVREFCLNWIVDKLPEAFETLEHKWEAGAWNAIGTRLNKVILNPNTPKRQAQELISTFVKIAPMLNRVRSSNLHKLNDKELKWFLSKLPSSIEELNLSKCLFSDLKLIERFTNLKVLTLRNCSNLGNTRELIDHINLESLDLTGCVNLENLECGSFKKLRKISIVGCSSLFWLALQNLKYCTNLEVLDIDDKENLREFKAKLLG